jgi:CRISPR system Cascade subunit CasE
VTDPERFTAALVNGIGKARAFGCGLMLIRRV